MLRFVAAGVFLASSLSFGDAQTLSIDKAMRQTVSVRFREISVAEIMDFLATHGVDVAARTSDINLRERVSLSVGASSMHDVMQAIAGALGARWSRSGHIFILSRAASTPQAWIMSAPLGRLSGLRSRQQGMFQDPSNAEAGSADPEAAFQDADEAPSAVVSEDGAPAVGLRSLSSTRTSYLVRLTDSGDWAVAERWTSSSKTIAHHLKPKLSIGQRHRLATNGYLSASDLTELQMASLGEIWPDGKWHAIWNGRTLLIRP